MRKRMRKLLDEEEEEALGDMKFPEFKPTPIVRAPAKPKPAPKKKLLSSKKPPQKVEWPKSGPSVLADTDGDLSDYGVVHRSSGFFVPPHLVAWLRVMREASARPLGFQPESNFWVDKNPDLARVLHAQGCVFQEEGHVYLNRVSGNLYSDFGNVSVTSLIKRLDVKGYNFAKQAPLACGRSRKKLQREEFPNLSYQEVVQAIQAASPALQAQWQRKYGGLTLAGVKQDHVGKAQYGSDHHHWIESYLKPGKAGKPPVETPQHAAAVNYFNLPDNRPELTVCLEMTMSFPDLCLVGRVDYIGRMPRGQPNEVVIKDWKTYNPDNLKYMMKFPDWLEAMFPLLKISQAELQLMLYQFLFERLFPHLRVARLVVVYFFTGRLAGTWQEKFVEYNDAFIQAVLSDPLRELLRQHEEWLLLPGMSNSSGARAEPAASTPGKQSCSPSKGQSLGRATPSGTSPQSGARAARRSGPSSSKKGPPRGRSSP